MTNERPRASASDHAPARLGLWPRPRTAGRRYSSRRGPTGALPAGGGGVRPARQTEPAVPAERSVRLCEVLRGRLWPLHALFFHPNPTLTSPCTTLLREAQLSPLGSFSAARASTSLPLDSRLNSQPPRKITRFLPALHVRPRPCRPLLGFQSQSRVPDSDPRGGARTHPRLAFCLGWQRHRPGIPAALLPSHPSRPRVEAESPAGFEGAGDCPTEHPAPGRSGSSQRYLELSPTRLCNNFEVSLKTQINSAPLSF